MELIDLKKSALVEIINWLTGLRCVTDFENSALDSLEELCRHNQLLVTTTDGGLKIGKAATKYVFITHIDRIGFVAVDGKMELDSVIKMKYIYMNKLKSKVKENREKELINIIERFSNLLLVGFRGENGKDLFLAKLVESENEFDWNKLEFKAQICYLTDLAFQTLINNECPIPVTAVMPCLNQIGGSIHGYLDNSAGLAIALKAVSKYPEQLSCIATVSEEGGGFRDEPDKNNLHGGRGAQNYIRKEWQEHKLEKEQIYVIIDVRPSEIVKTKNDGTQSVVGGGVVLRQSEKRKDLDILTAHPETFNKLIAYSENNKIPYQVYNGSGITEAGRAQEELNNLNANMVLKVVWLQPPVAFEHKPFELTTLSDLNNTLELAEALASF